MPEASRYEPASTFEPAVDLHSIDGLSLRHMRAPEDFVAMTDVGNASRIAAGDAVLSVEDMASAYAHLVNCDLARDALTAFVDDRLVGYGRCFWYDEPAGDRIYQSVCFLDPVWRRRGIGRAMLRSLEARIAEIALTDPTTSGRLQVHANTADDGRVALLRAAGYEPVRYEYTMLRSDLADQADAPLPLGLEIRDVRPEHLPAIWAADQEAFADHWGNWVATEEDYEEFLAGSLMDTTLWLIAWDRDEVVGEVRCYINAAENEQYDRRRGWIQRIGVRRHRRRQGVAQSLIAASLPLLRARGMTEVALNVDTENASGALRLYERMGFQTIGLEAVYRKSLA